ncbi:MAG: hypothetical protein AAGJ35_07355, partial [Myxococcota bacterium]
GFSRMTGISEQEGQALLRNLERVQFQHLQPLWEAIEGGREGALFQIVPPRRSGFSSRLRKPWEKVFHSLRLAYRQKHRLREERKVLLGALLERAKRLEERADMESLYMESLLFE